MALALSRRQGESIIIGGRIKIEIVDIQKNQVKMAITAPENEKIFREEILLKIAGDRNKP